MLYFSACRQQADIIEDLVTDVPLEFDFLFSRSHVEVISGKQEGELTVLFTLLIVALFKSDTSNCCLLVSVSPHCETTCSCDLVGVYAWIGINFVLGRFDHPDEGECDGGMMFTKLTLMFVSRVFYAKLLFFGGGGIFLIFKKKKIFRGRHSRSDDKFSEPAANQQTAHSGHHGYGWSFASDRL